MTTFVINLEKISEETQKLYQQLSSYEEDFDNIINNFDIYNFSIDFN